MKHFIRLCLIFFLLNPAAIYAQAAKSKQSPLLVIFETDLGNDVDDALAMDMLYKYYDDGLIKILAMNSNKVSPYSYRLIDIMNNWYGYPKIPIGKVDAPGVDTASNFAKAVCTYQPAFKTNSTNNLPTATEVYRKVLSKQADQSVIIISTGFSTNLAKLLASPTDQCSKLSGKSLVEKKVKLLSVMGGNFIDPNFKEYNIEQDIKSAQQMFASWPSPIACSPFELGDKIRYPGASIQNDFKWAAHHPMVIAYENYIQMPYDRSTWDLTSVLYAIEGKGEYFNESTKGNISVSNDGITHFSPDANGKHWYLTTNAQQDELIKKRFLELITRKPKSIR